MTHKLSILATVFYDDFPVFEVKEARRLTTKVLDTFFNLLGWRHAVSGDKATEFSDQVVALGVQYSLEGMAMGKFTVQSKPGRLDKIKALVQQIQQSAAVSKEQAAVLGGLLNFAGGFVMGHSFKPSSRILADCTAGRQLKGRDKDDFCNFTLTLLDSAKPRDVLASGVDTPGIVYTDGAFENGIATWGALLVDKVTGAKQVLHGLVPQVLVKHWLSTVGDQIICEVEAYAYMIVRWEFRKFLNQRLGICFIDNEAARIGLIKRSSRSLAMFLILAVVSLVEVHFPFAAWVERVPSASNPADWPTRNRVGDLCAATQASDCGDIVPPPFLLSFLMSGRYDQQMAEVLLFEMV
eukprot:Skav215373  [mRNA]  locus=scaffold1391:913158:914213:- [translate_table: standard]